MRFRRRDDEPAEIGHGEIAPDDGAAPASSADRPVAAFAAVLDGRRLTVAVDASSVGAAGGRIALRPEGGGPVLDVAEVAAGDPGPAQPGFLDARLDLHRLPDDTPGAAYDVVLVPPGGEPLALWSPPLPDRVIAVAPYRTALLRTPDGTLRVRRGRRPETVRLADLRLLPARPESARLRLVADEPLPAGTRLVLLTGRGEARRQRGSWPLTQPGPADEPSVDLTYDGLVPGADGLADLVVETVDGRRLPLTRADNSLDPRVAVSLPRLDLESGSAWLKLRWNAAGRLQARFVDLDEAHQPAEPAEPAEPAARTGARTP